MTTIKYLNHLRLSINLFILTNVIFPCVTQVTEIKYLIQEEMDPGTFVGDVFKDARLFEYNTSLLSFQLLGNSDVLKIDQKTGIITTTQKIDREALDVCQSNLNNECEIKLKVVIKSNDDFKIISVKVTLIDVNDNAPYFERPDVLIDVPEATSIGTSYELPIAKDKDSSAFSVKNYRLISDSDKFKLDDSLKINGKYVEPKLIIKNVLDRETKDKYLLTLIAEDGGNPAKNGSVDVEILVSDVNDNIPIFEKKSYHIKIDENIPVNTMIGKVKAYDRDLGLNGEIEYSLSILSSSQFGKLFGINEANGEIFVKGEIDYETYSTYNLSIIARDKGIGAVAVNVPVIVSVTDVNDNAPEIGITTLSNNQDLAEVMENSKIGTFVAQVSVTDKDSGQNGKFECFLNEKYFSMNLTFENDYQILVNSLIDREKQSFYNVVVHCTDLGNDPLTTLKALKVNILDENDNDPVFSESSYMGEIYENNFAGLTILTVNATDADSNDNGKLSYYIDPQTMSNFFSVDQNTGVLKAIVSLDREKFRESVKFWIVAKDKGTPPRSSSAVLTVLIKDLNDEYPIFTYTSYSFAVAENQEIGSEVGTVAAQDLDSGLYGDVIYSLSSDIFKIDQKSGRITTLKILDREEVSAYHVIVYAGDRGVPSLSSSASVTIHVSDENDNTPVFEFPSSVNNSIQISNLTPREHVIGRVRARDHDTGKNGKVIYTLKNDSYNSNAFALEPEIGTIMLTEDMRDKDGSTFDLEISAQDGGIPARMAFVKLHVVVNKSVPFILKNFHSEPNVNVNFTIILLIASISGLIVTALIIAIVILCRQDRQKTSNKYNCRLETLKLQQAQTAKNPVTEANSLIKDHESRQYNFVMEDALKHLQQQNNRDNVSNGSNVYQACPLLSPASNAYSTFPVKQHSSNDQNLCKSPLVKHHQSRNQYQNKDEVVSLKSANGSNTDSGHGPSEEGEFAQKTSLVDPAKGVKRPSVNDNQCNAQHLINNSKINVNTTINNNFNNQECVSQHSYPTQSNTAKMSTFQRDYGPDLLLTNQNNYNPTINRCLADSQVRNPYPNYQPTCSVYQNPFNQSININNNNNKICNNNNNNKNNNYKSNNQVICMTSESQRKLLDNNFTNEQCLVSANNVDSNCDAYSCQDVSEVLKASPVVYNNKLPGVKSSYENTPCNSVIDAEDLCNEIDELFFKDLPQPTKWNKSNF